MRDFEVINPGLTTITAVSQDVTINCAGLGSIGIGVSGTFTATLVPEGTINNSSWVTLNANPLAGGAAVTSITAAGSWIVNCAGLAQVRLRCSAYTSGTITVKMLGSVDAGVPSVASSVADTELPASAANLDINAANTARTTATKVLATQSIDAAGAVLSTSALATAAKQDTGNTSLSSIDGKVTACNTGAVTISGALPAGSAIVGQVGIDQTTPGTTNKVSIGTDGTVAINAAIPAGTNAIGKLAANSGVDIGDVDITSIAAGTNLIGDVGIGVRTSGGTTPYKNLDVDESEDEVKGTAGQVYWMHVINLSAAKLYLKFYNATAANVTVGTTVPVLTLPIPTLATTNGNGFVLCIPNGIAFSTAITIAATTGFADNDTGAPGANEVIVNLGYN